MLADHDPIATVGVADLPAARRFYEDKLGLKAVHEEGEEAVTYQAGGGTMFVYRSEFAGHNGATAVTWVLGDEIEAVVKALAGKGVAFEHYEGMPDTTIEGDLHVAGDRKMAWFKDPDGNIHGLMGGD